VRALPCRSERGIALVIAMLVLLVVSMLAIVLMTSVVTDNKITGHSTREAKALNIAEAGIAEALAQVRAGNIDVNNPNPRKVSQIFNTAPGSVPVLGTDSTAIPTSQPAGQWLNYSPATQGPGALTVRFRTDASRSVIYKYDRNVVPHIQTASGYPIFQVISTGHAGADSRQIVAEFIQKPINVNAMGAMVADVGIDFLGNSDVCGYNHSINTPIGTKGRGPCQNYELGYGDLPGAWSSGGITTSGSATQNGNPPTVGVQTGFYPGPWAVFDMTQSEFYSWAGAPQWPAPQPPVGITYLDNNSIAQDASASVAYQGGDGEGLLYVDGDMTINGNFTFKGMIYLEGDLQINGTCWILGGLVVKGKTTVKLANGNCTVLYSKDAIEQTISQYGGQFVNISWREP
jgi:hypothetical protein